MAPPAWCGRRRWQATAAGRPVGGQSPNMDVDALEERYRTMGSGAAAVETALRLGELFAAQPLGVVPDMIVFAKTVTNGDGAGIASANATLLVLDPRVLVYDNSSTRSTPARFASRRRAGFVSKPTTRQPAATRFLAM